MKREYLIVESEQPGVGLEFRGGAMNLWRCSAPEAVLAGASETGKTLACLFKLDALLLHFPRSQAVLCRKVRDTIYPTVLQTYIHKILGPKTPVVSYGGERAVHFTYPNGSRLWLAGMDDPGKALSSERDFIYVNQSEELEDDDWQVLVTRTTGRAGNAGYGQLFGDCNPGPSTHWIKRRAQSGPLQFFESKHEDNPTLWDAERSAWTEQGIRTIAALDSLTGVRKQRLRHGLWVSAEGQVYEGWDPKIHLIDPFKIPASWTRYWSIDFGWTNPFVCHFWAEDGDGRLYLYREIYLTRRLVEDHARHILDICGARQRDGSIDWSKAREPRPKEVICDHDEEGRATLERHLKITTRQAIKEVEAGIQSVAARLKVCGDGRPRLMILRNCLDERDRDLDDRKKPCCTAEEFEGYVRPPEKGGKSSEAPIKIDDHGLDSLRYMCRWLDHKPKVEFKAPGVFKQTVEREVR